MRASSIRRATPTADADSSCGDSGFSCASACASPTSQQQQQQPFLQPSDWQLNAMAMSAISELPSPIGSPKPTPAASSMAAAGQDKTGSSSRLTQSLSYGKGPSAEARRQALAHSLAMLGHQTRSRQRELDKREREVQEATVKATEQIEYVLKMTEKAHKFEDENQQLRRQVELYKEEIGKLLDELQERESELQERDEELARRDDYCDELLRELGRSRQDIAQIRTRADELKVENSVLSSSRAATAAETSDARLAAECEDLRRANQRLQRQLAQAEADARRAAAESAELLARVGDLAEERRRLAEEQGSDERSKRELLQTIRRLVEDKLAWETYCARLLRRAVECAPQLLCCAASSAGHGAAALTPEGRWERLFGALFKAVMQKDPGLAECVTAEPAMAAAAAACELPSRRSAPPPPQHRAQPQQPQQPQQPRASLDQQRRAAPRPILQPPMRSTRAAAAAPTQALGRQPGAHIMSSV